MFLDMGTGSTGEISKSFIPGKGWVPATSVPKEVLRRAPEARIHHRATMRANARREKTEYQDYLSGVRRNMKTRSSEGKVKGRVVNETVRVRPNAMHHLEMAMGNMKAYAQHAGGRKGDRMIVTPAFTDKPTLNHELAHVTPKRSSYRFHKILSDPAKAMREEARADMSSGHVADYYKYKGKANTTSGYTRAARSEKFRTNLETTSRFMGNDGVADLMGKGPVKNYKSVQNKIATARGYQDGAPAPGTKYANQTKDRYRNKRIARNVGMGAVGTGGTGTLGFMAYQDHKAGKRR